MNYPLEIVSLGQTDTEKKSGGGSFLTTVLLIGLAGAIGYAVGFERGATSSPRSRRGGWNS